MTQEPEQLDLVIEANRRKLIDFFEQGAPHYVFNMNKGLKVQETYHKGDIPSTCGTTGCIAGAAFTMWLETLEPEHRKEILSKSTNNLNFDTSGDADYQDEFDYSIVRDGALKFLGLTLVGGFGGHPLFNMDEAPRHCTAPQAVFALRRTFEGKNPWPQRTEED
jgi:hypothetical protein